MWASLLNGVAYRTGQKVTAIGEAASIDTFTVNAVRLGHIVYHSLQELHVIILLAGGVPACHGTTKHGEIDGLSLRIGHDASLLVGHVGTEGTLVGIMSAGTMQGNHQRSFRLYVVGNIKPVFAAFVADGDSYFFVSFRGVQHQRAAQKEHSGYKSFHIVFRFLFERYLEHHGLG